ncbi:hypothetical protein GGS21DRAFT_515749 [Xylaria nigripes]|nr:hypothetical protein GGS21DRAFT_515749 [Xylaria nigripes]
MSPLVNCFLLLLLLLLLQILAIDRFVAFAQQAKEIIVTATDSVRRGCIVHTSCAIMLCYVTFVRPGIIRCCLCAT